MQSRTIRYAYVSNVSSIDSINQIFFELANAFAWFAVSSPVTIEPRLGSVTCDHKNELMAATMQTDLKKAMEKPSVNNKKRS